MGRDPDALPSAHPPPAVVQSLRPDDQRVGALPPGHAAAGGATAAFAVVRKATRFAGERSIDGILDDFVMEGHHRK